MKKLSKTLLMLLCAFGLFSSPISARELDESEILDESSLSEVSKAGTYPVRVNAQDGTITKEKIIYVTVLFPNTQVSEEDKEAIDAHDFEVEQGGIETLSKKEIIEKADARAWSTTNGESIPIKQVAVEKQGDFVYTITFSTEKGTSTNILVREVEEIILKGAEETYNSSINPFELYSRYIVYGMLFLLFLIPLLVATIMYKRLNRLYKETEDLLYNK